MIKVKKPTLAKPANQAQKQQEHAQQLESLQKDLDLWSQEHAVAHQALKDVGKSTATLLFAQLKAAHDRHVLSSLAEK